MKNLTKKSLNELAMTMNVIPEDEQDNYWGMYDNDCFWRCVSWLKTGDYSEAGAASYAFDFFVSAYSYNGLIHLSAYNDSGVDHADMRRFLTANGMVKGINDPNQIVGVHHTSQLEYYRNNPNITPSSEHCLILKSKNSDGSFEMYDPQNNKHFTVSAIEAGFIHQLDLRAGS